MGLSHTAMCSAGHRSRSVEANRKRHGPDSNRGLSE